MFGALAATLPLPALLASVALSGALFGPMNALSATAIQQVTPPALLGRVFGAVTALSMIGIPLGATAVGVILAEAGLVGTVVGMGAVYLALAASMAFNPALRAMDTPVQQGTG
jgi:hypothetical protein